jgi:hypothetical protein
VNFIGLWQYPSLIWDFLDYKCARTNGMLPSFVFLKYKMAINFDQVLDAIGNENFEFDVPGISSDEEEDLDRRLEMSDSDSRQVFTCF